MIKKDIPLRLYSNFKIGGIAKYFAVAKNLEELYQVLKDSKNITSKVFVFGGGTNILFSDLGFDGLVLKVAINGIEQKGNIIRVGAGVLMSELLDFCITNSLSGLEWAGGLPGTVGGAIRGNAGAYNGETKDNIKEIESFDINSLKVVKRKSYECKFSYRTSIFKKDLEGKEVITYATFELKKGIKEEIKAQVDDKIGKRKLRHPLEYPNLGSIFQNIPIEKFTEKQVIELNQYIKNDPFPVIPTAKLNFLAGLAGTRVRDAQLSEKHTNFIINLGGATAEDVKKLISVIKAKIKNTYGVELEEEISYLN